NPVLGYQGSASALLAAFFVMMVVSYFFGQKYYPVPYDMQRIGTYFFAAAVLYILSLFSSSQPMFIKFSVNTFLLLVFILTVYKLEKNQLKRLFSRNVTK